MARPASVAIGGYFPTPAHLIPDIAALIDTSFLPTATSHSRTTNAYALLDPCAGDGTAIISLYQQLFGNRVEPSTVRYATSGWKPAVCLYTAELETGRAAQLQEAMGRIAYGCRENALCADAFKISWLFNARNLDSDYDRQHMGGNRGIDIMLFNPPYDAQTCLEEQFLTRFTPILAPGSGILVAILPAETVLRASTWLAAHYDNFSFFRFPDPEFAAFRQVVLFAQRATTDRPIDSNIPQAMRLRKAMLNPGSLPVLPKAGTHKLVVAITSNGAGGLYEWSEAPIDMVELRASARPWQETAGARLRYIQGTGLEGGMDALRAPNLTMPLPPRPGYIALAMSVGLFDGQRLLPNNPTLDLPEILLRATFSAEYTQTDTKVDKHGKTTAVVEVQQPKLRVCVLDLRDGVYYTLPSGSEPTGATQLAEMNVIDLIDAYSVAMRAVLRQRVPTLHDPARSDHQLALPQLHKRTLFKAQEAAVMAALKLLQTGQNVFVLGDVGAGKTTVAASILWALARSNWSKLQAELQQQGFAKQGTRLKPVRRALVIMPPHLPPMWAQEIGRMLPGAHIHMLDSLSAVARMAEDNGSKSTGQPGDGLVLGLLSREAAKLGSEIVAGVAELQPTCPRCGTVISDAPDALVRKRLCCTHTGLTTRHPLGRLAVRLAYLMLEACPDDTNVRTLVTGRYARRFANSAFRHRISVTVEKATEMGNPEGAEESEAAQANSAQEVSSRVWSGRACAHNLPWAELPLSIVINNLVSYIEANWKSSLRDELPDLMTIVGLLLMSTDHPERDQAISDVAHRLYRASLRDSEAYGYGSGLRREVVSLVMSGSNLESGVLYSTIRVLRCLPTGERSLYAGDCWGVYDQRAQRPIPAGEVRWGWSTGTPGKAEYAKQALGLLMAHGKIGSGKVCGEPLWQMTGRPRRFPLATYIARYYPDLAEMLILDEAHDYRNADSAQTHAVERLIALGTPVLKLTGTVSDGKARSLFTTLWSASPAFRAEFGFEDVEAFVRRYGYLERTRQVDDDAPVARNFGSQTDRVEKGVKTGEAPGVRPDLLLRHLLPLAVTISRGDLEVDLPAPDQIPCPIVIEDSDQTGKELQSRVMALQEAVVAAINRDRFQEGLAGKLWGALATLPSAWDRLTEDTGNRTAPGDPPGYRVCYPQALGGKLVAEAKPMCASVLLPKERRLVEILKAELAENRNVMVWGWHTGVVGGLPARLRNIIRTHTGVDPLVLEADKVPPIKRQDWIEKECIQKGKRILFCHPMTVSTGLNNLVWFQSAVWYENPGYSAIMAQQAVGRIWRPGMDATRPLRVYWLFYSNTLQALAYKLTLQKIAAAQQAQGQDWRATLAASGLMNSGELGLDSVAIGQRLFEMMEAEGMIPTAIAPLSKLERETPAKPVSGQARTQAQSKSRQIEEVA